MPRTTKKDLNNQIDEINRIFLIENRDRPGSYELDCAYGGYALHKIVTLSGGTRDVFSSGHIPARELCNMMRAYLLGLAAGN